jgi:hypothetical protein
MLSGSGSNYSLNLSSVSGQDGNYVLTLVAAGSAIQDAAGNPLSAAAQDSWTTDTTPPTADIGDVTPDPRNTPSGVITITFSEPVTGLDIADFTLTRDGSPVSLTQLVVNGSQAAYSVNLSTVSAVPGNYVLTLRSAGSAVADAAGNLLAVDAVDSWTTDTVAPTANFVTVTPDPRNSPVGSLSVAFSESVAGVDISDFTLTRDGGQVTLTSNMLSGSGANYSLNLSTVTGQAGSYSLSLAGTASEIRDAAGNLLSAAAQDSWLTETTPPTADIVDTAPDPRNSAVGAITITFSEPVTGLDINDFALTRDGNPVSLTGLAVNGAQAAYTLDFSTSTQLPGNYVLTLRSAGSGVIDAAGNPLNADAQDIWTIDTTAPTADIADIAPDPRNTFVGSVTVTFSETVSGVDIGDFALTRDGNAVALSGGILSGSGSAYTLNLSSVTAPAGIYTLTLAAADSAIRDAAGNALAASAVDSWLIDLTGPTADIVDVAPDPRNTSAGVVTIGFSEPVSGVDLNDFRLTRDGSPLSMQGVLLSGGQSAYELNLTNVSGLAGTYVLTLVAAASDIRDAAGNSLATDAIDSWSTDTALPMADITDVTPDPRSSAAGIVTITFTEPVSGVDINDFTLTRNSSPISLAGLVVNGTQNIYTLNLSSVTSAAGSYVLTLVTAGSDIRDAAGNSLAANSDDSWLTDGTLPAADIVDVTPDPRNSAVESVAINFSEPVSGVDISDFRLTRDGAFVALSTNMLSGSGSAYSLNLSAVTGPAGAYVLSLESAGSGITDEAGNALSSGATDAWTTETTSPIADILDITPDPRNAAVGDVAIGFSEPVSGLDIGDFTLTRDGSPISLAGAALEGNQANYTLNLSSLSGAPGAYVLRLGASGSGIVDAAGNPLSADLQDSWMTDTALPTADIVDVSPDPRSAAVVDLHINFSEPITGVDIGDFALTRDGSPVSLIGVNLSGSEAAYTLDLSTVTALRGHYVLTLHAAGSAILDVAGNSLAAAAQESWMTDTTAPTVDIATISPNPRNGPVSSVAVTFSEPVSGVDLGDFTLTREGNPIPLATAILAGSGADYMLDLTDVTTTAGSYVLTLTAQVAGIHDGVGNPLLVNSIETWTIDTTAPTANIVDVTPDPRSVGVGNVTIIFTEPVGGVDVGDFTLTRDGNPVSLAGLALNSSQSQYSLNLSGVAAVSGAYVLSLAAAGSGIADVAGNLLETSAQDSWLIDAATPAASIAEVSPNPRSTPLGDATISFSESIVGLDLADFTLTRDGNFVSLAGSMLSGGGANYTLNLGAATRSLGTYVLTLVAAGSGIRDASGNQLQAGASITWRTNPWHNYVDRLDVDGVAGITALDALLVINELNSPRVSDSTTGALFAPYQGSPYLDVSDDGYVSFIDALLIFNHLNMVAAAQEQPAQIPPPVTNTAQAGGAAPPDVVLSSAPMARPATIDRPHAYPERPDRPHNHELSSDLLELLAADPHRRSSHRKGLTRLYRARES